MKTRGELVEAFFLKIIVGCAWGLVFLGLLWLLLWSVDIVSRARAHEAPSGWMYDVGCCGGMDCRQIDADSVKSGPAGYTLPNGDRLGYRDTRVHVSPDGHYHWCTAGGRSDPGVRTYCLYVPPQWS